MSMLELDGFEARGDAGGPVRVAGEEDVLGQFAWSEPDVVLPFSCWDRDPAIRRVFDAVIRVRQDLFLARVAASLARNSAEDSPAFSRASSSVDRAWHHAQPRSGHGGRAVPVGAANDGQPGGRSGPPEDAVERDRRRRVTATDSAEIASSVPSTGGARHRSATEPPPRPANRLVPAAGRGSFTARGAGDGRSPPRLATGMPPAATGSPARMMPPGRRRRPRRRPSRLRPGRSR